MLSGALDLSCAFKGGNSGDDGPGEELLGMMRGARKGMPGHKSWDLMEG